MPYAKIDSRDGRYSLVFVTESTGTEHGKTLRGDGYVYISQQVYAAWCAHMAQDAVYQELFTHLANSLHDD